MPIKLPVCVFKKSNYDNHKSFRVAIRTYLRLALKGRCVQNSDTSIKIEFNNVGIDKMVSSIGDVKAICLCNLQLILKNGILCESVPDRQNRPDIESFILLKTDVQIEEEIFECWSYIREKADGNFLYSININAEAKKTL